MIELTEEIVYEAMRRAKIDQDKVILKAKEKNGPKTPRTGDLKVKRADETIRPH